MLICKCLEQKLVLASAICQCFILALYRYLFCYDQQLYLVVQVFISINYSRCCHLLFCGLKCHSLPILFKCRQISFLHVEQGSRSLLFFRQIFSFVTGAPLWSTHVVTLMSRHCSCPLPLCEFLFAYHVLTSASISVTCKTESIPPLPTCFFSIPTSSPLPPLQLTFQTIMSVLNFNVILQQLLQYLQFYFC